MNPEDELDLYTLDMQWLHRRLTDSRNEVTEAYKVIKDLPIAREHLANAVGTLDTINDRISRFILEPGETPILADIKSNKPKSLFKRIIG